MEINLTITRENGGTAVFTLTMSDTDFEQFQALAKKRGVGLSEVFAEALRLEQLFAESREEGKQKLYLQKDNELRELVAV